MHAYITAATNLNTRSVGWLPMATSHTNPRVVGGQRVCLKVLHASLGLYTNRGACLTQHNDSPSITFS